MESSASNTNVLNNPTAPALRHLQDAQNIFGNIQPTPVPNSSPTPRPLNREFNFRACLGDDSDYSDLAGVADIRFVYDVESTKDLLPNQEKSMLDALEKAMVDSIFESECGRRLRASSASNGRRLAIHSISSGMRDKVKGGCAVTSVEATVCNRYDGGVKVGFNSEGKNRSKLEAGNTALTIVSRDMNDNNYLGDANTALSMMSFGDVTDDSASVTRISFVGTDFYNIDGTSVVIAGLAQGNYAVANENGFLSDLGQSFLPIMCLLFVGAIVALFFALQSRKRRRRVAELAVLRAKHDSEFIRRKQKYRGPFDEAVHDLALRSCNQDVHRCNKTECVACSQPLPMSLQQYYEATAQEPHTVEVVDPEETDETHSVISSITNPKFLGGWLPRSKSPAQATVRVEERREHSGRGLMDSSFDDEPPSVTFVPVKSNTGGSIAPRFIDHTGVVQHEM